MASTTTDKPVKQRASAAGVSITIGLATVVVDLVPAAIPNKDKASQFHSLCAECDEPTRLRQVLACPNGHEPITIGEVAKRGKEIDGTLVEVTAEEIDAVRGADMAVGGPKAMNLSVVRSAGLIESTLNGDVVYRLRPNAKTTVAEGYELLRRITVQALRTGRTLVGEFSVGGGSPRLFALTVRHGQVLAQALLRPDDVADFDSIPEVELAEKVDALLKGVVEALTTDFDPVEFRNQTRERAEQLIGAKEAAGSDAVVTPILARKAAAEDGADLESLLSTMLAAS